MLFFFWTVYVIEVYIGDKAGAGTDAHVFVTLFGKRGQTPKTQLISRWVCSFTPDQLQISFIFSTWKQFAICNAVLLHCPIGAEIRQLIANKI